MSRHIRLLAVLVALVPAIAGAGAANPAAAAVKLKVAITDARQNALTGPGLKVRLSASQSTTVRLTFTARTFDDGTRTIANSRKVRLGKGKPRTIRVKLLSEPRAAARGCEARTVVVDARHGKRSVRASSSMLHQRPDCRLVPVDLSRASSCDWIAQPNDRLCLLPFPNDYYTVRDASSSTGRRISFKPESMPKNATNKPIDPGRYSGSDGFSQGQGIVLKIPGIDTPADIEANGFVGLDRLSRYAEPNQKAVVIEAKTGRRWPIWVEVDANATDPAKAALMISPARNFNEKGRYIVALRNLVDGTGKAIAAPNAFRYLRDGIPSYQGQVNQRRDRYEGIFKALKKAGIRRSDLYLAWDFTVASNENNYGRVLSMRDRAFAELGDTTMADGLEQGQPPAFAVTPGQVNNVNGPQIRRVIRGTFTVPCFLTEGCEPGGVMERNASGLPVRNGSYQARLTCIIPQVDLPSEGGEQLWPLVHGHGLLGDADGVQGGFTRQFAQERGMLGCATDEIGMAEEDIPVVLNSLNNLTGFHRVPDRLQQGLLNELFLARLMVHPDGLSSHPAFQDGDGTTPGQPVMRSDEVFYEGVSQGGIMGGALTAISPDLRRTVLRVGAMNYSTMVTRSSNWELFGAVFNTSYPDQLVRPLLLGLMQILWDRGEPNGYAHVMTENPPPDTPTHKILKLVALGDHQVSNFASDVQARSVAGFKTNLGAIDPVRWPDYEALWGIPRIQPDEYPYRGSAIIYWDTGPFRENPNSPGQNIGTGLPPYANVYPTDLPPNMPLNPQWEDPHGSPRDVGEQIDLMGTFLRPDGYIDDECLGAPCLAGEWDGDFDSFIPVGP